MPERKPAHVGFESWVDQQIREATDRGEFDNLPGTGKLTGLQDSDDELWWVKNYLRREGLPTEALLPTALQLRKEIERRNEGAPITGRRPDRTSQPLPQPPTSHHPGGSGGGAGSLPDTDGPEPICRCRCVLQLPGKRPPLSGRWRSGQLPG